LNVADLIGPLGAGARLRVMNELIDVLGEPPAIWPENCPELAADTFDDWAKQHVAVVAVHPTRRAE
jgi:hypothetical protein